jgi:hypothetical protein
VSASLTFYPCYFSDTFQEQRKLPLVSNLRTPKRISADFDNGGVLHNDIRVDNASDIDVLGTGLKNEVGEYNCFLNVIIQVLLIQSYLSDLIFFGLFIIVFIS